LLTGPLARLGIATVRFLLRRFLLGFLATLARNDGTNLRTATRLIDRRDAGIVLAACAGRRQGVSRCHLALSAGAGFFAVDRRAAAAKPVAA
jgi:hypothetical protein